MQEIVKHIEPEEFGLTREKVASIDEAFEAKISEIKVISNVYDAVISKDITREVAKEAGEARKKLVKIRTGIAKIHKTQKAFFLSAGRYVDAWKNKETEPVVQMESTLSEIENYYINLEKERIAKLHEERYAEIKEYIEQDNVRNFGEMTDADYDEYFRRAKKRFDDLERIKKEEELLEKKRIENERIEREKERAEMDRLRKEKAISDQKIADADRKAKELEREIAEKEREKAESDKKAKELERQLTEKLPNDTPIIEEGHFSDQEKLNALIRDLDDLKSKYIFDEEKYAKIGRDVATLIARIITYIDQKS